MNLPPPLRNPFLEKNIDTFFNYVNLNLCNFLKGGHNVPIEGGGAQSLLILWGKVQGMKNIDGKFAKKYLYFHRIDTYCIINYDIKYIFTLKAILIKAFFIETFFVKGKSEILKYFCNYT